MWSKPRDPFHATAWKCWCLAGSHLGSSWGPLAWLFSTPSLHVYLGKTRDAACLKGTHFSYRMGIMESKCQCKRVCCKECDGPDNSASREAMPGLRGEVVSDVLLPRSTPIGRNGPGGRSIADGFIQHSWGSGPRPQQCPAWHGSSTHPDCLGSQWPMPIALLPLQHPTSNRTSPGQCIAVQKKGSAGDSISSYQPGPFTLLPCAVILMPGPGPVK